MTGNVRFRTGASRRLSSTIPITIVIVLLRGGNAATQTSDQESPAAQPPAPQFRETIEVVGVTPIHGLGVDRLKVPGNIQVATASDLERTSGLFLGEQLAIGFGSVHVNEAQTNPFQADVQFRGFAASPLLGLPQGIAVYQDGVRVNEPFGDTVNWDLVPTGAIASVNVMPGSNPLFGLNALGGALSIQTKTGFSHPGHAARVSGGSWGRRWVDAESGAQTDRLSYFVAGRMLSEDGWRDHSPSRIRQIFGNGAWRGARSTLRAAVTAGDNRLIGNGAAPVELLATDRSAIFTHPDETTTQATLASLSGQHTARPDVVLEGTLFYRPATIGTFNGDDTAYDECASETFEEVLCDDEGEGEPVVDQFGRLVPADEDDELDGTNNTSNTRTRGWGGSLQMTVTRPLAGSVNHLVVGTSLDAARSRYESDTELARLTETRGTEGTGLLDSGAAVRLRTNVRHTSLYAADFFTITPRVTAMGSARFTHSAVELRDQLGEALTGDHTFNRLNPAAGLTVDLGQEVATYASYSEASRVPTPSELSCADPDDPCRLPNAFVADPPLEQVVTRTWEGGVRGRTRGLNWAASAFRSANRDDIIFISSGALTNEGYFANVGDTLRRGVELNAFGRAGEVVRWEAAYTYLRATFGTPLTISSPNHPDAMDGEIDVGAGSSIPSVPRHNLKGDVAVTLGRTSVGAVLTSTSSQFLRGDEANRLRPIEASAVVHLTGSYLVAPHARITARVTNLFGAEYATFGLLGEPDEVLGDEFEDPRFVSPGPPRAAWLGIELAFR